MLSVSGLEFKDWRKMLTVSGLQLGLEKNVDCQWSSVGIGEYYWLSVVFSWDWRILLAVSGPKLGLEKNVDCHWS